MPGKGPRARVLIVDDDEGVRRYLEAVIAAQACAVTLAQDGTQALAMLAEGRIFDLVITDYSMPGSNGIDVLRAVRERLPKARAVMMSASFIDRDTREAVRKLVDQVLVKPVDVDTIHKTLDRLLGVVK
jgi:CheY-like chemotaxis protein